MKLSEILTSCRVKTVTASPTTSLAEAARALFRDEAALVLLMEDGQSAGILTCSDILRILTMEANSTRAFLSRTVAESCQYPDPLAEEETVGWAITRMTAGNSEFLPVISAAGMSIVSLNRLLMLENNHLHQEVQNLQNYIDALHDAPNE